MIGKILQWAERKRSKRQRIATLALAGAVFLVLIPLALTFVSSCIDEWLGLPGFIPEPLNFVFALALIGAGLFLSGWSVLAQFRKGKGTPAPMVPTQKLVTTGPFAYCRNPMTLGMVLFYPGFGFWTSSLSSIALTGIITALLTSYAKLVEERELEARFGREYVEYKKETPFLIPRGKHNRGKGE